MDKNTADPAAKASLQIAVLTVSDSRTLANDTSGAALTEMLTADGHRLADRKILPDDTAAIAAQVQAWIDNPAVDVVLTTGGTGVTGRDVTPEALMPLFEKTIPGFGELFRWLSFAKIGPATIQSRALAGLAKGTYIFALPGSTSACRDAWEGILSHQFDQQSKPCNFISLIPRLREK